MPMSDMQMPGPDYGEAGEAKLRAFVEKTTGGQIIQMERQVRWRPAWFLDVECDGAIRHLHLRGDREGGLSIFPELKREADVMEILHAGGVPVPRIHGFCADPPAILMDTLAGTRDLSGLSARDQSSVAADFMKAVVAMHRLPLDAFVAAGIILPQKPEAIALAGLDAYLPFYRRTKSKPEPLLEFLIGWIRRNVPTHRSQPAFIQFDSGQFHVDEGRMVGLYDFEFSMIGDPMVDLATMRMRDSVEPLGDSMVALIRVYEEATGEPVDHRVIDYHTLQFAVLGTMQFAGTVGRPQPGDPHAVYLEFDLALRQVILIAMSALTGIVLEKPVALPERKSENAAIMVALADSITQIAPASDLDVARKEMADQMVEWAARADAYAADARAADVADVAALLGQGFDNWSAAEAALESYVVSALPDDDEMLLRLFAAIEGRRMAIYGPTRIGRSATNVKLPPLR
jgi:aminoglycoside phosphotransferase (APT) family kinase protein